MATPTVPSPLAGRTALVTGAARRLGRALALALADRGVGVAVHYRRSKDEAETAAAAVRQRGVQAWTVGADLGRPSEAEALVPRTLEAAGPLDILVNSASVFPASRLRDVTPGQLLDLVQVNAVAHLQLSRAVAAQRRDGSIVNLLDARSLTDYSPDYAAYDATKRLLFTFTRMMALEFAPRIQVNAVAPGLILPPPGQDDSYLERLAHANPLHRIGSVDEVVRAVLFLLESRFITGQVLYVDGGRHLRGSVYG